MGYGMVQDVVAAAQDPAAVQDVVAAAQGIAAADPEV